MRMKILSIAAALLLVGACATESTDEGRTTGGGQAGGSSVTKPASGSGSGSSGSGSTASVPAPGSADEFITVGDRVFFDFNMAEIRPEDASTLNEQATWLKRYPNVTIVVEGHCDERGTREYNIALGKPRAKAVKKY